MYAVRLEEGRVVWRVLLMQDRTNSPEWPHTKRKGFLTKEHKKEFKRTLELELKRNY